MSNSGIIVHNDQGDLVLDNSYLNFYLSRKIELNGAGTTTGTFQEGEYIAAVGGLSDNSLDAYCENSPTGWTCTVKTYKAGLCVYVFSVNIPQREHGAGMQIYDANGRIIFDSALEPAKVLACGHTERDLPIGNYKYAMAVGAPITTQMENIWYTQDVTHSQIPHNAVTHQQWVPEEYYYRSVYHPEEYHYGWVTDIFGNKNWDKIVDKPAYWSQEKVVTKPAHYETVIDKPAWTEYVTEWETWKHIHWTESVSNFGINNKKILIRDIKVNEYNSFFPDYSSVFNSGKESSEYMYPIPPGYSEPMNQYYSYVINPTSFLLFDVANV